MGRVCEYTKIEREVDRRQVAVDEAVNCRDGEYEVTRATIVEIMNSLPPDGRCRWTTPTFGQALRDAGVLKGKCWEAVNKLLADHDVVYDPAAAYRQLLTSVYSPGMKHGDVVAKLTAAGRRPSVGSIRHDLKLFNLYEPTVPVATASAKYRVTTAAQRSKIATACRAAVAAGMTTYDDVYNHVVSHGVTADYFTVWSVVKRRRLLRGFGKSAVRLTDDELVYCRSLVTDDVVGRRAEVLVLLHTGCTTASAASIVGLSQSTVWTIANNARIHGIQAALYHLRME